MKNVSLENPSALLSAEAGIHCVGWLPDGMDDLSLVREAAAYGIDLAPVSSFSFELMARKGALLGYSEYSVDQILDGVQRLAAAMHST